MLYKLYYRTDDAEKATATEDRKKTATEDIIEM